MTRLKHLQHVALLCATFVIAICGLVYELLAGTLSSYLLGDSIYQFSLVIGLFMSSMGIGSWFSRFIEHELPVNFIRLQLLVGLVGGLTAPILYFAFAILDNYTPPALPVSASTRRNAGSRNSTDYPYPERTCFAQS